MDWNLESVLGVACGGVSQWKGEKGGVTKLQAAPG